MHPGMSVAIETDTNNIFRLYYSSFVGVVGGGSGGGSGNASSGTTVPFTLGSPGLLSPGSLFIEGLFRAHRWAEAF